MKKNQLQRALLLSAFLPQKDRRGGGGGAKKNKNHTLFCSFLLQGPWSARVRFGAAIRAPEDSYRLGQREFVNRVTAKRMDHVACYCASGCIQRLSYSAALLAHHSFWISTAITYCRSLCFSGRALTKDQKIQYLLALCWSLLSSARMWRTLLMLPDDHGPVCSKPNKKKTYMLTNRACYRPGTATINKSDVVRVQHTCTLRPTKAKHIVVLRAVHGENVVVEQSCPFHNSTARNPKGKQHRQTGLVFINLDKQRWGEVQWCSQGNVEPGITVWYTRRAGIRSQGEEKGWQSI